MLSSRAMAGERCTVFRDDTRCGDEGHTTEMTTAMTNDASRRPTSSSSCPSSVYGSVSFAPRIEV